MAPIAFIFSSRTKQNWYAGLGIPEYWILDPEERSLQRLQIRDGHFQITEAMEGEGRFLPGTFPGLEIELGALWDSGIAADVEGGVESATSDGRD